MKKFVSKLILPVTITGLALPGIVNAQSDNPNIVFILADDFGYSSLNSYGADPGLVRTPNIDEIAATGMRFTNASTPASVSSPTRYGFLTGRYPWRTSMKFGVVNPTGILLPDPERVSIADWLKKVDYNTAAIGKWHLGYGDELPVDFTGKLSPGPLDLGFDYHFGVPQNHDDMLGVYIEDDHIYGLKSKNVNPYSRNFYGTRYLGFDAPQRVNINVMEDLTDKTIDWLKKQSTDKPFFVYFAPVAVHHPITPSDHMRGLSDCGPYGDFIQDLDISVGKILETLKYMGLMENTIVIFSSDNGGEIPKNKPDSPEQQAISYGLKINGDLRGDKHTIWEGGTRVPFIVSWPGKVSEGSVSNDMINVLDIFATVGEIIGDPLPKSKNIAPDSFSFLGSLLNTRSKNNRTSMVTADANGMHAIHMDGWKYIDNTPPEGLSENKLKSINKSFKPQLYNIENDPEEKVNLYSENPDQVKKLAAELEKIRNSDSSR